MINLGAIATCFNGYTFPSGKRFDSPLGNIGLVQASDIKCSGYLDLSLMIRLESKDTHEKFYLQEGDLVFLGRGCFIATVVPKLHEPVMVASPLIVIRLHRSDILPAYLSWVLNSQFTKHYFERSAQGTILKAIGIKELVQLNISVPPIDKQKQIVQVKMLNTQEQSLIQKIQHLKERQLTQALFQMTHQYDQTRTAV